VIEGDVWDILVSGNGGYSTTSHNNTFINCTFNPDSIRFDDDGTVVEQNYLEILVYDYDNLTVSGADVKIKDNSNVVYSTSYYDGDDATTDDNGLISLIPLTYTIYEYGEDPTTNVTTVEVHYRTSNVSRTVNMSTSHTENFSMPFGPEWSYETGDDVYSVAISADGEYIATGSWDDKVYLFDKDSSMLLWSYDTGNNVHSVAISADGEYIVAGNEDYKVYFFDKDSSTPLWNYTTPDQVRSVSISADGEYIVVGSWDYKVYLFDKDSSTPLWSYETGHNVNYVDISADGEYIIVGSYNKLYLFDKDSGTPLWNYSWSSGGPACIDISADGEYIAVGSYDNKAYLFDKDSSTPLWSYDTGEDVFSVSISMDGEYIAAASRDKKVYLFGKDSGTPLWSYTTGGDVWSVSISADGEYITAGSYDNKAYLFDKDSSTPLWSYTTGGDVWSVTISADGKYIAAGSFDDKVYTFKNSPASRPSLLTYGPRNGSNTDTDPQLGWFASSDDRANLTFDVYLDTNSNPTTKVAEDITTFYHNLQCLDINTKYYWKVVATDGEGSVTSSVMNFTVTSYGNIFCVSIDDDYDPAELTIIKGSTVIWTNDDSSIHTVKEDDDEFESGSILPGNSWSYTFDTVGSYNYSCQYDDDYQGQIIVLASYPPTATINSISPQIAELDGSVSFSGSGSDNDGTISEYLWNSSIDGDLSNSASFSTTDLSFGNHTITFRVKDNDGVWSDNVTSWVDVRKSPEWSYDIDDYGRCYSIAISADGEYIVVGTTSPKIHLFGKNSSTPLWSYTTGDHVEAVAISADGEYIVAGSSDDKVYLFDKDSSTPLWSYTTGDEVLSVTISADGEYIAAGSDDEKVYLFGKDSSTPLWSYSTGDNVRSVSISADGEYITAGSYDDNVYLFDKDSSTPLWNYSIGNNVYSVAISADGEYVVAGGSFGVYLFDKDSSVPFRNWDEGTDTSSKTVSISADGEYIAVATHESTVSLFDKYSNSSLWSYTAGDVVRSVSISLDGKYIAAVSHDENVYFFGKSSGTPLWSYSTGNSEWSVSISGDGKYVVSCPQDQSGSVHAFRNNPVSRPSVIPYGPSSGSLTLNDTTLGWFPGSDDITNLTFDVYMSFIYNDVANNNSAALIADDITNYTHSVTGLTESKKYYWKVVATDPSGSATSRIMNFTVGDSTAPVTDITSGPSDPSDYSNATFYFEADEDNVDFKCKIDTENWQYCSSPETYTDLSRGTYHQFKVKATDPSGNEGEPDTWIWEILDNDIPELTDYNVNPNPAEPDQRVYFYSNFSDSDGYIVDHSWTSSIDGFLSSSGNFSTDDLSAGYHSISLRAKDDDGDWSAITTFELDIEEEDTGVTPQWSYEMDGGGLSTDTSQDGQYIVVGSEDDYVYLFQSGNSTPLWSYDTGKNVNSVAISADGWSIVAGSNSNDIIFWHRNSSTPVWEYDTDSDVLFVDITADGNYVVAANEAKRIYYFNTDDDTWDSKKYIWKCEFASGGPELKSLSLADNGMSLSVALGEDLYFFDLGKVNRELNGGDESKWRTSSYDTDFISTALSSDGEYVVASTEGGEGPGGDYRNPEIRLWNRGSSNEKWSKEIDDNATTLAISANGEYIVAGCDDDKVYLFDKDSSTPLWSYDTGAKVTTVSISSDGQFILAGQEEGKLFLFNKNSGTPLWNYTNTGGSSFVSVEISKDGDIISATGEDDKVYVFNNNASSSLSVILYSPIHEERLHPDDTLRWFWNSDDESNLVFDVYLGTNSSSLSKVASNLTTSYYQPENLEVHTYYYWKVVAKDSSGTNTSDVKVLYKKWWWSYQSGRAISGVSADGEYILSGLDISGSSRGLYLFDKHSNVPLY
jgi:WD40 repeat protein